MPPIPTGFLVRGFSGLVSCQAPRGSCYNLSGLLLDKLDEMTNGVSTCGRAGHAIGSSRGLGRSKKNREEENPLN
jgi:hypothetical protein